MAPLAAAILSTLDKCDKDSASYIGWFDNEWCIGSVPQGGYSLSVMTNAIQSFMRRQSQTKDQDQDRDSSQLHVDPFVISASYLAATTATVPYSVDISVVKRGRGFTNLEARIVQKSHKTNEPQVRISAQVLMTSFTTREKDASLKPTIPKGHKLQTTCPISPIEKCQLSKKFKSGKMNMRERLTLHEDLELEKRATEDGELKWAGWLQAAEIPTKVQEVGMGNNNVPFFLDMMLNPVDILPKDVHVKEPSWYPTMHLTIEFKRKIPHDLALHRAGVYMHGRFVIQGQQDLSHEVWTHPQDNPLLGIPVEEGPQILAVGRQTALTFPLAINQGQNQRKESGQKAKI